MLREAVEEIQLSGAASPPARLDVGATAGRPKRIWSINGDFLALRPNGVARYAREVTLALDGLIAERHPLTEGLALDLIAPRPAAEPLELHSIPVRLLPEFNRPRLPQVWVQAQLPRHIDGGLLSFCNLAPVALRRQVVCIHDLHTRLMPESYGRLFRWAHRAVLPALGRRAAYVTTVSNLSRDHLVRFGVAPSERIVVAYNGSDHAARWDAARSNLTTAGARPYALCLGRDQRYKNAELMVRLAPMLDAIGLDLWMAGDVGEDFVRRHAAAMPTNLRLLGRIGDDDLKAALSAALCFLFPSRIEGFGLPAVEAMAAGCPVIAAAAPCLPEICGDAALYAGPDDPGAWAGHVRRLRDDPAARSRLVEAGWRKARGYSWRKVAETYLELMMRLDRAEVR